MGDGGGRAWSPRFASKDQPLLVLCSLALPAGLALGKSCDFRLPPPPPPSHPYSSLSLHLLGSGGVR